MNKTVALVCLALALGGCRATTQQTVQPTVRAEPSAVAQFLRALAGPGPGLAAHDPQDGSALFEQIPNWDNAAQKRCCSALGRAEYLKAKCDTDQPVYPRTNRC